MLGKPITSSSRPKNCLSSSKTGGRSTIGRFNSNDKTLLELRDLETDGALIIVAEAEIIIKRIAKKRPKAVKEPKTEAKKLRRKFM
jgi:hypothetical protein